MTRALTRDIYTELTSVVDDVAATQGMIDDHPDYQQHAPDFDLVNDWSAIELRVLSHYVKG